jgi:hypothetical protein
LRKGEDSLLIFQNQRGDSTVKRFAFVLGLVAIAVSASTARADVAYQYVTDMPVNAAGQPTFTGPSGSTVTTGIYLQETVTKGTSYLASDGGLFGGGYQVTIPTASLNGAAVTAQSSQTGAGGNFFGGASTPSGPTVQLTNTFWRMVETTSLTATSGPTGTVNGAITKVLLGTATFQVGSANATFTLGKKTSGTSTQSFNSLTNLDVDNASLAITGAGDASQITTININVQQIGVVPEPSSMALCGLAACSMGIGAWRRYKAKKAANSAKLEEVAV